MSCCSSFVEQAAVDGSTIVSSDPTTGCVNFRPAITNLYL
jgi:hypothetical protein